MLINIHDAKTNFSKIIKQALKGEDIIIAKDGQPLIRLIPYVEKKNIRKGGQLKGITTLSDDFDHPLPNDLLKLFYDE